MSLTSYQWIRDHDRLLFLSFLWLAAMMLAVPAVRADIYYWTDEQGVIHFSNQDAPQAASLYMREPKPVPADPAQTPVARIPSPAQDDMQARLERTNRQLERALERVEDLSDKIRDSQQEAAVAAALAQQAAQFSIASAQQRTEEPYDGGRGRAVYYSAPYYSAPLIHHSSGHFRHNKFKHDKFKHHRFKHHNLKTHHGKFGRSGRIVHHKSISRHSTYFHRARFSNTHRIR